MTYDWRYENSIINGKEIPVDDDYSQWRTNSILANPRIRFYMRMKLTWLMLRSDAL
jgi:hypothetical protein